MWKILQVSVLRRTYDGNWSGFEGSFKGESVPKPGGKHHRASQLLGRLLTASNTAAQLQSGGLSSRRFGGEVFENPFTL
jgi:hypothetical protein